MQDDPFVYISEEKRMLMLDKDLIESTYSENKLRDAARRLGVSPDMFARALKFHNIRIRSKGERIQAGLTKDMVPVIVARAYHKAGRCPPNCPGKEQCLSENGKCVVNDYLAGRLGPIV